MVISEKLFKGIQELSKTEWDALKVGIDYLFALELKKVEKNTFLSPNASEKLRHCPKPISLQKTGSLDHGNITGEHGHRSHYHSAGGHVHSMGEHRHSVGDHSHAVVGHSILAIGTAEEWKPYLGIVDSKDLLDELHKRGEDTEKLVIAAWKEGESLTDIEKKFGDFGLFAIEKYKERKRIRV